MLTESVNKMKISLKRGKESYRLGEIYQSALYIYIRKYHSKTSLCN
jgi:hypothetical protein